MVGETLEMHRDFPRWYAALAIGNDEERRDARWAGVNAVAEKADRAMVEALVRLAFQTPRQPPSNHSMAKIHETFREQDDTFDSNGTAREMQVLAGACLALLFEQEDEIGAAAALSVATAAFAGARTPNLPLDIVMLAEAGIERIANAKRIRPTLSVGSEAPKFDFEAAANKVKSQQSWEAVGEAFTLAADSARTALNALAKRQMNEIRAVDRFIQIQDEELQMLWWLMGGRSFDLDCTFEQVATEAQPLVFATELADSTAILPGPRPQSIKFLLVRAGLKERKKLAIAAAINAAETSWLSVLVEEMNPSPVTAPIHFAIKRQIEAGGGETWIPNWAAVVGVEGSRQISTIALGTQFYRERLLVRFE